MIWFFYRCGDGWWNPNQGLFEACRRNREEVPKEVEGGKEQASRQRQEEAKFLITNIDSDTDIFNVLYHAEIFIYFFNFLLSVINSWEIMRVLGGFLTCNFLVRLRLVTYCIRSWMCVFLSYYCGLDVSGIWGKLESMDWACWASMPFDSLMQLRTSKDWLHINVIYMNSIAIFP